MSDVEQSAHESDGHAHGQRIPSEAQRSQRRLSARERNLRYQEAVGAADAGMADAYFEPASSLAAQPLAAPQRRPATSPNNPDLALGFIGASIARSSDFQFPLPPSAPPPLSQPFQQQQHYQQQQFEEYKTTLTRTASRKERTVSLAFAEQQQQQQQQQQQDQFYIQQPEYSFPPKNNNNGNLEDLRQQYDNRSFLSDETNLTGGGGVNFTVNLQRKATNSGSQQQLPQQRFQQQQQQQSVSGDIESTSGSSGNSEKKKNKKKGEPPVNIFFGPPKKLNLQRRKSAGPGAGG
ncbi:hypothetical protein HK100_008515, partial [Physocladia obscura]